MILCTSMLSVVISPFSFLILFYSSFFLDESGQWFDYCIYLLKESAFSFVDFCYSLLCFFFTYFHSDFNYFFPSTNFGFLLFLVALSINLDYLFDVSLVSWGKFVLLWTFLLALLLLNPIDNGLLCFYFHFFLWIFLFLFWFLP